MNFVAMKMQRPWTFIYTGSWSKWRSTQISISQMAA
jgi:hypothetical protein